jgi:sRNA-binding protein
MTVAGLDTTHLRQAEATARAVHEQKKALRRAERESKKLARSSAHEALSPEQRALLARHRRRRARQVALIFLLASLATLAAGIAYITYVGDILIAAVGGVGTLVTLAVLSSLSGPAQVTVTRRVVAPASVFDQGARPAPPLRSWTPQPVPRSLQQSPGSVAAGVVAQQQAADARRQAMAEQAYVARVSASRRAEPPISPAELVEASTRDAVSASRRAEPVEAATPPASRFAGLGIVDDADTGSFDLDSALQRRRVG